jgi:hypothetical protein
MQELIRLAKEEIPSVDAIIEKTWIQLNFKRSYVQRNFGEALVSFDERATKIFMRYEKDALVRLAKLWLEMQKANIKSRFERILAQKGWNEFLNEASKVFAEFGDLVQQFEKDLGNMRKARGGKTFEKVIIKFLSFIGIKSEIPRGIAKEELRRIDIVIPSVDIAIKTPDRAIFLTCKRTLRERWKQEVPQARLNQRIYLLTIDDDLSEGKAIEINQKGLIAFVRDELAKDRAFGKMPWVRRLSDLPGELKRI